MTNFRVQVREQNCIHQMFITMPLFSIDEKLSRSDNSRARSVRVIKVYCILQRIHTLVIQAVEYFSNKQLSNAVINYLRYIRMRRIFIVNTCRLPV